MIKYFSKNNNNKKKLMIKYFSKKNNDKKINDKIFQQKE